MKLQEFVEKIKDIKKGTPIEDLATEVKDKTKCHLCKKMFKGGEKDVVSDVSGNLFHRECFDKLTGNDELAKRRTDNQLPYEEETVEESYNDFQGWSLEKIQNHLQRKVENKKSISKKELDTINKHVNEIRKQRKDVKGRALEDIEKNLGILDRIAKGRLPSTHKKVDKYKKQTNKAIKTYGRMNKEY